MPERSRRFARRRWVPVAVAAVAATCVAALGAAATDIGPWYQRLHEPALKPPDWLFGPAWTLIYALTAVAGVLSWHNAGNADMRRRILLLFATNALLNVGWSELFFSARRPDWALIEVVPFWLSIVVLAAAVWPASRRASLVLLPYVAWVAFAGWLNLRVVQLNPSFGAA